MTTLSPFARPGDHNADDIGGVLVDSGWGMSTVYVTLTACRGRLAVGGGIKFSVDGTDGQA